MVNLERLAAGLLIVAGGQAKDVGDHIHDVHQSIAGAQTASVGESVGFLSKYSPDGTAEAYSKFAYALKPMAADWDKSTRQYAGARPGNQAAVTAPFQNSEEKPFVAEPVLGEPRQPDKVQMFSSPKAQMLSLQKFAHKAAEEVYGYSIGLIARVVGFIMFIAMLGKGLCKWFQQLVISHSSVEQRLEATRSSALPADTRPPQEGDSADPPKATGDIWRLRILQFNIWQEGTEVDGGFDQIVDVIIACEADIVTLSEVRNYHGDFHGRLKLALREKGYTFYGDFVEGGDVGLLSRWPCKSMRQVCSAKAQRSFITAYEIQGPRKKICVCTAHLDWKQYALNPIRGYDANTFSYLIDDGPVTDIQTVLEIDEDSGRGVALQEFTEFATELISEGMPVFLGGDFNECSHEDWTAATKDKFGHNGLVVPWEHSKILAGAGFQDAWRVLYPNPVTHLGATWPSVCSKQGKVTSWAKQADERDRIDFIYYSPLVFPKNAWLVGPDKYFVRGKAQPCETQGPFFDAVKTLPWPSDHKGLLVDFEIPVLVAADKQTLSFYLELLGDLRSFSSDHPSS